MRRIEIDRELLRRMIEDEDLTQREAAQRLGVRLWTVERRCKEWGLKTAKTGPRGGHRHFCWRGGLTERGGYLYRHAPKHPLATKAGYVLEHRLIMEAHLGRYLTRQEVVHHVNRDRKDNRLENLQLMSSNGEHLRQELGGCYVHKLCLATKLQRATILDLLKAGAPIPFPATTRRRRREARYARWVRLACEQAGLPCPEHVETLIRTTT